MANAFPSPADIKTNTRQGRGMEINASSISNMKQAQIQSEVSNKMAKTTLDTMKAEGAQILEMMESVPKPSPTSVKGSVVDTRA
jgi:hypothetical protein